MQSKVNNLKRSRDFIVKSFLNISSIQGLVDNMKTSLVLYSIFIILFLDIGSLINWGLKIINSIWIAIPLLFTLSIIYFVIWYRHLKIKVNQRPSCSYLFIGIIYLCMSSMFLSLYMLYVKFYHVPFSRLHIIILSILIIIVSILLYLRYRIYVFGKIKEYNNLFIMITGIPLVLIICYFGDQLFIVNPNLATSIVIMSFSIIMLFISIVFWGNYFIACKYQIDDIFIKN